MNPDQTAIRKAKVLTHEHASQLVTKSHQVQSRPVTWNPASHPFSKMNILMRE